MLEVLIFSGWILFLGCAVAVLRARRASWESEARVFAAAPTENETDGESRLYLWVERWLRLAGYRNPVAPVWFFGATALAMLSGIGLFFLLRATGLMDAAAASASLIPGGVGEVMAITMQLAPWMLGLFLTALPWLAVRRARQARIERVEQDLPVTLELLATLSEAGLGFDAALEKIAETRLGERPLAGEFRSFQADLLAGRGRVVSLRRVARRLEVPAVSIFVSAMVQAEQLGMGIAAVLRRQADDLRDRRRERANAFAQTLPVKRMFPLVVCFLPGIFVWTLGPAFVQLFQMAETFVRVRNF